MFLEHCRGMPLPRQQDGSPLTVQYADSTTTKQCMAEECSKAFSLLRDTSAVRRAEASSVPPAVPMPSSPTTLHPSAATNAAFSLPTLSLSLLCLAIVSHCLSLSVAIFSASLKAGPR